MRVFFRHVPSGQLARLPTALTCCARAYRTKGAKSKPKPGLEPKPKKASKAPSSAHGKVTTPVAERLAEAGIWNPRARVPKDSGPTSEMLAIDAKRVNIVSRSLCDDIAQRLGPSLQRHHGCDLIDLNPGVGLWSQALHEVVQPRRHIMMDAQAESYQSFLSDWLQDKENVHILPKSGIAWTELQKMFEEYIGPSHTSQPQQPNDTLLVTANIATFPKKPLFSFDSPGTMLLYQLIRSLRTSSLMQRYGTVRMLIWANDEQKHRILPRSLGRRKRFAFETEISCEWVHEVAGYDDPVHSALYLRDEWLNLESGADTVLRMREQGMTTPAGRETRLLNALHADPSLLGRKLAGYNAPNLLRPFKKEFEVLDGESEDDEERVRFAMLRRRSNNDMRDADVYLDLLQKQEAVLTLDPASPEFAAADQAFNERFELVKKNQQKEFYNIRDNYHIFRRQPVPAMLWDRRPYEPLAVQATEFFPNAPCTLLDIQPKAMNPLFTQFGADTTRSGDTSDYLLQVMFKQPAQSVHGRSMDGVWPGFAEMADRERGLCPSLYDPKLGGSTMTDHGSLSVRALNERQWAEVVGAWMEWPFRPAHHRLIGRFVEDDEFAEDDDKITAKTISL